MHDSSRHNRIARFMAQETETLPESILRRLMRHTEETIPGWHAHHCGRCDMLWQHDDMIGLYANGDDHDRAHTCPGCGCRSAWKAYRDEGTRRYVGYGPSDCANVRNVNVR